MVLKSMVYKVLVPNPPGYLYGSTDADIEKVSSQISKSIYARLSDCQAFYCSPALRCIKTPIEETPEVEAQAEDAPQTEEKKEEDKEKSA